MKKFFYKATACALGLLSAFGAVGCGKPNLLSGMDQDYDVNINLDPNISATLTVLVPSTDGGVESTIIDTLAKGFKEKYPNVTIQKRADMISDEMYMDTIGTLVQSKTMPDLVYTNTAMYYYLVSKHVIVNLDPFFEATTEAGTLDLADYYDEYFNMATYEDKKYVMPRNADTVVTYFNTEMLEDAGISTSGTNKDSRLSNNWTWENFISVCEDLVAHWDTDRNKYANYYCIRQTVFDWESIWNPIMQSFGANAYENGQVALDSQATRDFAQLYKSLVEKRIVPSWDSGSNSRFTNGNAAFEFSSNGPAEINKTETVKGKFDILPFPLVNGENAKIGTGFAGWGISSTSQNRDLAWAFLHYMISEEGQLAMSANGSSTTPSLLRSITEEKTWAREFTNLNLDAFMAHSNKKIISEYFKQLDPSHMFDIQYALQRFARNCLTSTTTIANCISIAVNELQSELNEL